MIDPPEDRDSSENPPPEDASAADSGPTEPVPTDAGDSVDPEDAESLIESIEIQLGDCESLSAEEFERLLTEESGVTVWWEPSPIPETLHSDYDRGPFKKCVVCEDALTDGRLYQVQKTFRGNEVVFEMAVCERCGRSTCEEFSEESLVVMQTFVGSLVDGMAENEDGCGACGNARDSLRNYSIVGLCRTEEILLPAMIVCEECEHGVQERLSKTTRERQGEFIRDNFPGVPADLDLAPLQF